MSSKVYEYDVAVSYAGEDRPSVEALVRSLDKVNVKVFYDRKEIASLWGENLTEYLVDIYQNKAQLCIVFISVYYAKKIWTKYEFRVAQARALENAESYILPIKLDNTNLKGLLPTTAFIDWHSETPDSIARYVSSKLNKVDHTVKQQEVKFDENIFNSAEFLEHLRANGLSDEDLKRGSSSKSLKDYTRPHVQFPDYSERDPFSGI